MSRRTKDIKCFGCEEFYRSDAIKCPNCGQVNESPTGKAEAVDLCSYELDGDTCPLYAAFDKRWCAYHNNPGDREHTDANRRVFEQILIDPNAHRPNGWHAKSGQAVKERIKPDWSRQEGEPRDDYHDRMMALTRPLYARIGSGLGMPIETPIDRKAIQEAAKEERRRQAFQHVELLALQDRFEDRIDELREQGLELESAYGLAFEETLKGALS